MTIDSEVENAIKAVARELNQPDPVAKRLIAWLEDEATRDLPHVDRAEHLHNLLSAISLEEG